MLNPCGNGGWTGSGSTLRWLIADACRGISLARSFSHYAIHHWVELRGTCLDLGTAANASYDHLLRGHPKRLYKMDLFADKQPDVVADIESSIPVQTETIDAIICINVLEHIYHIRRVMAEVARVLRPGGRFHFTVPFIHRIHGSPHDHYRYTPDTIRLMADEAGLQFETVHGLCGAGASMYVVCWQHLPWRVLRLPFLLAGFAMDALIYRWRPSLHEQTAVEYYFRLVKPGTARSTQAIAPGPVEGPTPLAPPASGFRSPA